MSTHHAYCHVEFYDTDGNLDHNISFPAHTPIGHLGAYAQNRRITITAPDTPTPHHPGEPYTVANQIASALAAVDTLRAAGYAVALWQPDEIPEGHDARSVQAAAVQAVSELTP